MAKKHQYKASGSKTRTGQHRKTRHKAKQQLSNTPGSHSYQKRKKYKHEEH